ncbi:MAG: hypothetical protein KDJ36_18125, partial [Hyphomicrobiaceae bacterium]|nr:hypothetical protein [Hyphomicrobiaceae bacterium]
DGIEANPYNPLGAAWSQYDYLSWGVFKDGVGVAHTTYQTPNPTVASYRWNPRLLADVEPPHPPALPVGAPPPVPIDTTTQLDSTQPWLALQRAVPGGMLINLPSGPPRRLGWDCPNPSDSCYRWGGGAYQWSSWGPNEHLQLYADCALVWSDFMRANGSVFYTIGQGESAPLTADPYQNAGDPLGRKDNLMTRLAVDPCTFADFNIPFPGVATPVDLAAAGTQSGSYYPVAGGEDLRDVFMRIARRIRLRMLR